MIQPILEEISEEEYYEHTKEDKYDRNPHYIKEACYDGQGVPITYKCTIRINGNIQKNY